MAAYSSSNDRNVCKIGENKVKYNNYEKLS